MTNLRLELERRRDEFKRRLEDLRRAGGLVVERSAETVENASLYQDRERAAAEIDRVAKILAEIDHASLKHDDAELGFCERCEEPIGPARLKALPWARLCLECQGAKEEREKTR